MMPRKETVILVHGTWAGPSRRERPEHGPLKFKPWYCPGSDFSERLNEELRRCGSAARCWAHLENLESAEPSFFSWDGSNSFRSRAEAASKLSRYIQKLNHDGWTCHVVAHSHGGNILVDVTDEVSSSTSKYVTLGTPYVRLAKDRIGAPSGLDSVAHIAPFFVACIALIGVFWSSPAAFSPVFTLQNLLLAITALVLTPIALFTIGTFWFHLKIGEEIGVIPPGGGIVLERLLVINSDWDEALSGLRLLQCSSNPLLAKPRSEGDEEELLPLWARAGEYSRQFHEFAKASDRLVFPRQYDRGGYWLAFTLVAIAAVLLSCARRGLLTQRQLVLSVDLAVLLLLWTTSVLMDDTGVRAAVTLPYRCARYMAIYLSRWTRLAFNRVLIAKGPSIVWGYFRTLLFGLEGSPVSPTAFELAEVPFEVAPFCFVHERLPERICQAVVSNRDAALSDQRFLNEFNVGYGFDLLLRKMRGLTTVPLVHSHYYENVECIERIARWIGQPPYEVEWETGEATGWFAETYGDSFSRASAQPQEERPKDGFGVGEWAAGAGSG